MKKEKIIDYFMIDGVKYDQYEERQTAYKIRQNLEIFRKKNRPSSLYINALLQIQQYQNTVEILEKANKNLHDEIEENKRLVVYYWFLTIIWLIVFSAWFRAIVCFFIKLFS